MRSARRVEKPGTVASSATEADFTPARLPNRSSSWRRRLGPTPGMLSSSEVIVRVRAALPVVGQPEAVRLVARPLQQAKRGAPAREPEALGPPGQEDLLLPLGQAHHRNRAEAELVQRVERGVELSLAAVDDERGPAAAAPRRAGA